MTTITRSGDRREASLGDTLDFLNTDELDGFGRPVEHLATLADFKSWLGERDLLPAGRHRSIDVAPARLAAARLAHVARVRAGLREVVEAVVARRPVDAAALGAVNAVLRARGPVELAPAVGGVTVARGPAADPLDDALAALAEPLVAAISAGATDRLRVCANDGCQWVFEDASRSGRGRWCSMASCGNRAKAARHRARMRAAAVAGGPGVAARDQSEAAPAS